MKTLLPKMASGLLLALCLSMTSCEKDALLTPDQPGSARSAAPGDGTLPTTITPPLYQLTRLDNVYLTYYPDGRLKRAARYATPPAIPGYYEDYTYQSGPNNTSTIQVNSSNNNGNYTKKTFWLNDQGRCYKSVENVFQSNGQSTQSTREYKYNAQGQLHSCEFGPSGSDYIIYDYTATGDVSLGTYYSYFNKGLTLTVLHKTIFEYSGYQSPLLLDFYPINSLWPAVADLYLPIFGKQSKHLVSLKMKKYPDGTFREIDDYQYKTDANGYVTERKHRTLISDWRSEPYEYLVTKKGLNP